MDVENFIEEVFMLVDQADIDHIQSLLLHHVGTIPDAFVRIKTSLEEIDKSPNNESVQSGRFLTNDE
jgi:hypothetical protein